MERGFFRQDVQRQRHEHAHQRGDAGGQRRAENAHAQRIHEHIVQHDVRHRAGDHADGGKQGRIVVAHESDEDIAEQEAGRECHQHLEIGRGHFVDHAAGAQKRRQLGGEQPADRHARHAHRRPQQHDIREDHAALPRLAAGLMDGEHGGAAHAQQQPQAVEHAVDRDGEIQRRQAQGAHLVGHEKRVRQVIDGQAQHAQNAHRRITGEAAHHALFAGLFLHGITLFSDSHFFSVYKVFARFCGKKWTSA